MFQLDLQKMPLGKLSHKQLQHAFTTLNELSGIIDSNDEKSKKEKIIEVTNRFYTQIPHDFGIKTPQPIDSKDILNVCSVEFLNFLSLKLCNIQIFI